MASVHYGGGPSIDERRDFSGLKGGTQVPGYRGYCPQLKYRVGKTYGKDTFEIAEDTGFHAPTITGEPHAKPIINHRLPESTGDNKYTQNMVPGYTGYIPRQPFKFGASYKVSCDDCIDQFLTMKDTTEGKHHDLVRSAKQYPRLQPIENEDSIRNKLNAYSDFKQDTADGAVNRDRREFGEPPIPGYKGYVPRIYTTELGLGVRYHEMTRKGLDQFQQETARTDSISKQPISINRSPVTTANLSAKRLYLNDGMIPCYTGYIPQRRFDFGSTYGNATRSLDVCAHNLNCYGEYMTTQPHNVTKSVA